MTTKNDDNITNPVNSELGFQEICKKRFTRRGFVKTGLAAGVGLALTNLSGCGDSDELENSEADQNWRENNPYRSNFDFIEIEHGIDQYHHVAPDHTAEVLIKWGDPITKDAPAFDFNNQSAEAQLQQFGYNNDYVGYIELDPRRGEEARALLCINHEYPINGLMIPDLPEDSFEAITLEQVEISMAAIGCSIIEITMVDGKWSVNKDSRYNRRISALDTEMDITGPVAGHERLKTSADPDGKTVIGTHNNCAGGITPWGTYLTCEENFNYHFAGELPANHPETENHARYNVPVDLHHWGKHHKRFDVGVEPTEPNRFGWVVEIDPFDPKSRPKKRTALGRFKHEGAENVIAPDGRLVIYMGDDQRFEYLYKFVTDDVVDVDNPKNNRDILDNGTLYVAKFYEEGYMEWLPLLHDNGPLQTKFESQADVLLEPRKAADLLGATPMDRPEDVVPNKDTGKVFVMLTNNTRRDEANIANPRTDNQWG
ncbi:MAG: PhoX family phosphatase, partial [Acidiferrobacterales bacterium]|nr:PhoX family phosphatase [Acidiferrobacterales bacterium]